MMSIQESTLSAVPHGFFLKNSDVLGNCIKEFDFSFSKFQSDEITLENRRMAAKSISQPKAKLIFADQIHSSKVVKVDHCSDDIVLEADGLVTKKRGVALCILTADCAPILCVDTKAKVVGAAHAGWRGALAGIAENTIDAMVEIGASKSNITVSIGPCISKENYEVEQDFKKDFVKANSWTNEFFYDKSDTKCIFDLPRYIIRRLFHHEIKSASWTKLCTYEQNSKFHSYRHARDHNKLHHKRNISIISL